MKYLQHIIRVATTCIVAAATLISTDVWAGLSDKVTTFVVKSDASCKLSVNGVDEGMLEAGQSISVKSTADEPVFHCVSLEETTCDELWSGGTQAVVLMELSACVAQASATQTPEARQAARQKGLTLAKRFETTAGGVLDKELNVVWAARQSKDMEWSKADQYCRAQGVGWNLPTVAQLQNLLAEDVWPVARGPIQVGGWSWSSERDGSGRPWFVSTGGNRFLDEGHFSIAPRALCVRRP